jgi:DDE family transposase
MADTLDESWELLLSLFPMGWEQQAVLTGALERLRGFPSASHLLRVLLLHVGRGYSLRETAVKAKQGGLADVSDVALLNRLRKAEHWWRQMCVALLAERGLQMGGDPRGWNVRLLDGTLVKEPGKTGSSWRVHFSLRVPSLECDYLDVTPVKGRGTGEKLERFPSTSQDLVLADRGFCKPGGISALHRRGSSVIVRLNTASLPLYSSPGVRFRLSQRLVPLREPGQIGDWSVWVQHGAESIPGRLCAIRKSAHAAARARRKIVRKSQQGGPVTKPETLLYADYVMVFTTLPQEAFSGAEIVQWYRTRWQIELVFKQLKSLAQLGHLPKHDERSSRAWLYGKLLIALLGQKLIRLGRDISPWGYDFQPTPSRQRLASI